MKKQRQTMPLELTGLNSAPVAAVNCFNENVARKKKLNTKKIEKSKIVNKEFGKKKMAKWKSNLK